MSGAVESMQSMTEDGGLGPEIRHPLEIVGCPVCGGSSHRPRHTVVGYTIVDCTGCGLTFVNPQPTESDLAFFYEHIFHTPGWYRRFPQMRDFDYFGEAAGDQAGHQSYVTQVRGVIPGGAWLDVGCGHGALVRFAAEAGYDAYGVDPNPLAARAAEERVGAGRVFSGTVHSAGFPANRFTVVSIIGTVEHLKHPRQTLQEIFRILQPGGLILLQTPNLASLQYRRQGPGWEQFTPPGHLIYFTPRTLSRMLRRAGFRRVRFDMRFPLGEGWERGSVGAPRRHRRLGLTLARGVALLGSRVERAMQRAKGRLVGNHDIVCHARKPGQLPGRPR